MSPLYENTARNIRETCESGQVFKESDVWQEVVRISKAKPRRLALLSVFDKSKTLSLGKALLQRGIEILASEGTAQALREADIPCITTREYTGIQGQAFNQQVKTIHPRIAAGILWNRTSEQPATFEGAVVDAIDFVVVLPYPFLQTVRDKGLDDPEALRQMIDIGGISLLRAAAKNYPFVSALCDYEDFSALEKLLEEGKEPDAKFRRMLAAKAFRTTAAYDLLIAEWLGDAVENEIMPESRGRIAERRLLLRYGENPHQSAGLYEVQHIGARAVSLDRSPEVRGRVLSYNNLLDAFAGTRFVIEGEGSCCAIIKHGVICGCACGTSTIEAFQRAYETDPLSAFGGVVVFNSPFRDIELAQKLKEKFFTLVVAQNFSESVVEILGEGRSPLLLPYPKLQFEMTSRYETRSIGKGFWLLQTPNVKKLEVSDIEHQSERVPTHHQEVDLCYAFSIANHLPSNAVAIVREKQAIALGSGQCSRIDAVRVAVMKAEDRGHDLRGVVAASDGFFPFEDCVEELARVGVEAILHSGGGKNDMRMVECANRLGVALSTSGGIRAFRH